MFPVRDGSPEQKCYRCGEVKPADEFAWRRKAKNQRDSFCRPCRAAYKQEHYHANKQTYIARAAESKRRLRLKRTAYLLAFFADHPCSDCGERDPVVLDFDHIGEKTFEIAQALPYRSWKTIVAEMGKCEVVCANCHRRRTAQRRGSVRALLASEQGADGEAGDRA
jgi:hypothetical protein